MNAEIMALCQNTVDARSPSNWEEVGDLPDLDVIFIRELNLAACIGAYAEERTTPQVLTFNLEISTPANLACQTDQLADTIDYAEVVAAIRDLLDRSQIHLLEALAESVAELLFDRFGAHSVEISVAKEEIVPGARFVGVRIRRTARPATSNGKGAAVFSRRRCAPISIASC